MTRSVIFDVGHVLVDWDLRYLFRTLTDNPAEIERIVTTVVTPEWHFQADAGRDLATMVAERQAEFPADSAMITAYATRFNETIPGTIAGMERLVTDLDDAGVPLFAITNFGAEFWAAFRPTQPMFTRFRDIVVSGVEKMAKPDPAIFALALDRFGVSAHDALFIDDRADNVAAAQALGIAAHVFTGEPDCRAWLATQGVRV